MEEKYLTMVVDLVKDGKPVSCMVRIKDGFAVLTFSDPNVAIKWYEKDMSKGNINYSKKINGVIYKHAGMTKEQIRDQYRMEITGAGGVERT